MINKTKPASLSILEYFKRISLKVRTTSLKID